MLINLRNALMAGKRLPYDAEVEYLESTGTQWIDTGIALPNASLSDVTWVVDVTNFNDGCMGVFGQTSTSSMYINFYSNKFYMRNMRASGGSFAGVPGFNTIRFSGGTSYLNGTAVETDIPLNTNPTNSMFLFAYNRGNQIRNLCKARVSSFVVKVSDALIADYIPVRKGTVGYLYDRVSGKLFGNAGTGDFVLGQDVVPVEYIESHGTEYINTGIKPSPSTSVETVFAMTTFTANCGLFGARGAAAADSKSYNLFIINNNGARVRWDWSGSGNYQTSQAETSTAATYVLGAAGGNITRDGTTVMAVSSSKTAIDYPLYVFNMNNVGSPFATGANARFWSVKIYDGQTLGNNFLPVRVGTEGAMMDVLTRRIYRNAGTGAFTYGNDLKYPIPSE